MRNSQIIGLFLMIIITTSILFNLLVEHNNVPSNYNCEDGLEEARNSQILVGNNKEVGESKILQNSIRVNVLQNNYLRYNGSISFKWLIGPTRVINDISIVDNEVVIGSDESVMLMQLRNESGWRVISHNITIVSSADVNGDGVEEVMAVSYEGNLLYINKTSGVILRNISLGAKIISLSRANLDVDQASELCLLLDNSTIITFDYDEVLWKLNIPSKAISLYCGDINQDLLDEILVGTISGNVFCIENGREIWSFLAEGMVSYITSGDVTPDSGSEVLVGTSKSFLYVLNAEGNLIKRITVNGIVNSIIVRDINADKDSEMVLGTENGYVYIFSNDFSILNLTVFSSAIKRILPVKLDQDPQLELLIATVKGINATEHDFEQKWYYEGSISDLTITDYDSDNLDECLLAPSNETFLRILDNNGSLLKELVVGFNSDMHAITDFDNDGLTEYVLVARTGSLIILDDNISLVWRTDFKENVTYLTMGDINQDSTLEYFIALQNGTIICYEYPYNELWAVSLSSLIQTMIVSDVLSDNGNELVVGTDGGVSIINSTGYHYDIYTGISVTALYIGDDDLDNEKELFAGLSNGSLCILTSSGELESMFSVGNGSVTVLFLTRLNNDSRPDIISGTLLGNVTVVYNRTVKETISTGMPVIKIYPKYPLEQNLLVISRRTIYVINITNSLSMFVDKSRSLGEVKDGFLVNWLGENDSQLAIVTRNSSVILLSKNLKIMNVRKNVSYNAAFCSVIDSDYDDVHEIMVSTFYGLFLVNPRPEVWIVNPPESLITNESNTIVEWKVFGLIPLKFDIYTNNDLIVSLPPDTRSYNLSLANGSWVILVRAIPKSGRVLESSVSILVDNERPTVTILFPENNTIMRERSVTISWRGSDNFSGIDHYEIRIDEASWINVGLNTSYTFNDLSYGNHSVRVKVVDKALNVNVSMILITIDFIAPRLMITQPHNNSYISSNSVSVKWECEEDNLDHFEVIIDNTTRYDLGRNTSIILKNLSDGIHTVGVYAYDKAGNQNSTVVNFIIDTTPPDLKILSPTNGSVFNTTLIKIEWEVNETNFGNVIIYVNGSERVVITDENITDYTLVLSEGVYEISVVAYDKAENYNESRIIICVDLSPPIVSIIEPRNNTYYNTSEIRLGWVAQDKISGIFEVWVKIDDGPWILLRENITISGLSDGTHVIYLVVTDNAGNSCAEVVVFHIDTEAPYLRILLPRNNTYLNSSTVTVVWKITEKNLWMVLLRVDDGEWLNVTNLSNITLEGLSEGIHVVELLALDKAGNMKSLKHVFIVDLSPPEIIIYGLSNGTSLSNESVLIRWIVTDKYSPIIRVMLRLDNGSWKIINENYYEIDLRDLAEGKHVLEILAIDAAGNKKIVSIWFRISLKETIVKPPSPLPYLIGFTIIISILLAINLWIYLSKRRLLSQPNVSARGFLP